MNTALNAGNQCPICHQTAHVRHVAALYEEAAHNNDPRFSPPTKLAEQRFLLVPITLGIIVETVTLIAVMVTCATGHFSFGQYWLSVAGIGLPLILSVYAFGRMMKHAKKHAQEQYTWDEAMAAWDRSLYCTADDLVFDPATPAATGKMPVTVA